MQLPTAILNRLRDVRTQTALMVVLLISIFAVTGVLTYQAQISARKHQRAVAKILVSHANFAAAGYKEVVRSRVMALQRNLFTSVVNDMSAALAANYPTVSMSEGQKESCKCDLMPYVKQNVAYDHKTKVFHTSGAMIPSNHQDKLRSSLNTADLEDVKAGWKFILVDVPGDDHAVYS